MMNRKTLVTYILVAAVLILGIAAGVYFLYGQRSSMGSKTPVSESFTLLGAVPSDAAVLLCCEDFGRSGAELSDSTSLLRLLVSDGKKNPFANYLARVSSLMNPGSEARSMHSRQMALSLHYSGSMLPLMIVQLHEADSLQASLLGSIASDYGLVSDRVEAEDGSQMLLVSVSETLLGSSRRHLSEGVSILSDKSFADCASAVGGKEVLFFRNEYADRLTSHFLSKQIRRNSSFLKRFADWTAFSIESVRDGKVDAVGVAQCSAGSGQFANFLSSLEPSELSFEEVVPSSAVYALAVGLKDVGAYVEEFRRSQVADMQKYRSAQEQLRRREGIAPENWAQALEIREVVKTAWLSGDAQLLEAVMVRVGKKNYELVTGTANAKSHRASLLNPQKYNFSGFAASLFGQAFSVDADSSYVMTGEWIVSGSPLAIEDYAARLSESDCLGKRLDETGAASVLPLGDCTLAAYFSPVGWSSQEYCSKALCGVADELKAPLEYEPAVLSVGADGLELKIVKVWNSNQ